MMHKKGFTLVEIMVVIIIVGVLASLALMRYGKVIERARERDACMQLIAIHAANELYRSRANGYLPGWDLDIAAINTQLGLNIISNDFVFEYNCNPANPVTYQATADYRRGAASVFVVMVNEGDLTIDLSGLNSASPYDDFLDAILVSTSADASTPPNPCCFSGKCPTLPDCWLTC